MKLPKELGPHLRSWEAQLTALKGMTAGTGVLHEAQMLQLKTWGGLAFSGMGKWEANIDVDGKRVSYDIQSKKKIPKNLPGLIAALHRSVKWLLGDSWELEVSQGPNLLYDGSLVSKENAKRKSRTST